jgi:hypothetical protein
MRPRAALTTLPILGIGLGVYLQVIRPWQLRWGATDDEVRRALPATSSSPAPASTPPGPSPWRRHLL